MQTLIENSLNDCAPSVFECESLEQFEELSEAFERESLRTIKQTAETNGEVRDIAAVFVNDGMDLDREWSVVLLPPYMPPAVLKNKSGL